MKRIFITVIFLTICTETMAYSIPWETISGSRGNGNFGWNYSYDIGFFDDTLMIDLDIKLVGDATNQVLLDRWENGIEKIWSTDRFVIPISFNVDWVLDNQNQTVNIHDNNTATFNMLNWNTMDANGWGDVYQEEIVAHEVGHMFGLWDEYTGGAVDPVTGLVNTGGLMQTLNGSTLDFYYDDVLSWHQNLRPTPIPGTVWLLCSALMGIFVMRRNTSNDSVLQV